MKEPKVYKFREKYELKWLFGVHLLDMIELIGLDAAMKLFYFYGGTSIYLPKARTLRRQIRYAQMRQDAKAYQKQDKTLIYACQQISKTYKCSFRMVQHILGNPALSGEARKIYIRDQKCKVNRDEELLMLVKNNYALFKAYKIV